MESINALVTLNVIATEMNKEDRSHQIAKKEILSLLVVMAIALRSIHISFRSNWDAHEHKIQKKWLPNLDCN